MLRINRQTDYAVRVVLALSKREKGRLFPTAEIGREMLIPRFCFKELWRNWQTAVLSTLRWGAMAAFHSPMIQIRSLCSRLWNNLKANSIYQIASSSPANVHLTVAAPFIVNGLG